MFSNLPSEINSFMDWAWTRVEPYYKNLESRPLDITNVDAWLRDWTRLGDLLIETHARLRATVDLDTFDVQAEKRYNDFLDGIYPASQAANQRLKEKLLASGLVPAGFEVPLSKIRLEAALFHPENLSLLTQEHKLVSRYNKIIAEQTVLWNGQELTLQQLRQAGDNQDRPTRAKIWHLANGRNLEDRPALNRLWVEFMLLRANLAHNSGESGYLEFRWKQMLRQDYSPADCQEFQGAIESVVVPAASRVYEKHRRRLALDSLRPWDLDQDLYPLEIPALPTYGSPSDLQDRCADIFTNLDPQLAEYYRLMLDEGYLDLQNRKGKAPGGYCTGFPVTRRSFIFMNAVGRSSDVRTLLHESGHAFHNFERFKLPYMQQRIVGLEFAEVASMAMELLAYPFLSAEKGGFYDPSDVRRFQISHLEHILQFWPYMAVVDVFQHWVYTHHDLASDPARCDQKWLELWQRFFPAVDWSGLDIQAMTGWHRKQHIFRAPLYYVEYGLAQLGAVQVWRNSIQDPSGALNRYRYALRLGGTASLPDLYLAAGTKLAFDQETLGEAVSYIEAAIVDLEKD